MVDNKISPECQPDLPQVVTEKPTEILTLVRERVAAAIKTADGFGPTFPTAFLEEEYRTLADAAIAELFSVLQEGDLPDSAWLAALEACPSRSTPSESIPAEFRAIIADLDRLHKEGSGQ